MTLRQHIDALVDAIGAKFKEVIGKIGSTDMLQTTERGSVVGAVNELKTRIDNIGSGNGGAAIDDTAPSADKTYSSQKVDSLIDAAKTSVKSEILDGADAAYDTLSEVAKYIEQDKTGAAALSEAVAKRLRIDEAQVLTLPQKTAVETTLNLGDTDTDFVAKFNQALQS